MSFLWEHFCLINIYYGNILLHLGLEEFKSFLPTSDKSAIKNNPLMQLRSIFYKAAETNWKSENFKVIDSFFQQLIKLQLEWKGSKFFLFLSLFLPVHINFQRKLNPHKSLFIVTVNLFSSIALLILLHLQVYCFFLLIFLYTFNECEEMSYFLGSALFCF